MSILSAVGESVAPFKTYIYIGLAVLILAIIGGLKWQVHGLKKDVETLTTNNAILKGNNERLAHTALINDKTIKACRDESAKRKQELERLAVQLSDAVTENKLLRVKTDNEAKDIERESEDFKTGMGCPAYTVDFRRWLSDS